MSRKTRRDWGDPVDFPFQGKSTIELTVLLVLHHRSRVEQEQQKLSVQSAYRGLQK